MDSFGSYSTAITCFTLFANFVPEEKKALVKGFEKRLKVKHGGMQKEHRTRRY